MNALVMLAGVLGAHVAYYAWPKGSDGRNWAFYVGSNLLIAVALLLHAREARRWSLPAVGLFACWWGAIESAQCAACGVIRWGDLTGADLCVEAFGSGAYSAAAAVLLSALIVSRWRRG